MTDLDGYTTVPLIVTIDVDVPVPTDTDWTPEEYEAAAKTIIADLGTANRPPLFRGREGCTLEDNGSRLTVYPLDAYTPEEWAGFSLGRTQPARPRPARLEQVRSHQLRMGDRLLDRTTVDGLGTGWEGTLILISGHDHYVWYPHDYVHHVICPRPADTSEADRCDRAHAEMAS